MKRRFFQIHLLTLVVGMGVASGFMWANLRVTRQDIVFGSLWIDGKKMFLWVGQYDSMGWPVLFAEEWHALSGKEATGNQDYVGMAKEEFRQLKPSLKRRGFPILTVSDVQSQAPGIAERLDMSLAKDPVNYSLLFADIHAQGLLINVGVAVGLLLMVMIGTEWFLRRRERAKV